MRYMIESTKGIYVRYICDNILDLRNIISSLMEMIQLTNVDKGYRLFVIKDMNDSDDMAESDENILKDTLEILRSANCQVDQIKDEEEAREDFVESVMSARFLAGRKGFIKDLRDWIEEDKE